VPAFESSDGFCLSESNAIAFYLADDQLRGGQDQQARALVQQWMSFADTEILPAACSWVFPTVGVLNQNKKDTDRAKADLLAALQTLNEHLLHSTFLVGERISLADISVATTLLLPFQHVLDEAARGEYKNLNRWFNTIVNQPKVKEVVGNVTFDGASLGGGDSKKGQKGGKDNKKSAEKKEKATPKKKEPEPEADEPAIPVEKPKDPMGALPKGSFDMDDFKRFYSNNDEVESVPYFWQKFDAENYSIWRCDYKYADELSMVFMSCNLIGGMFQRLEKLRKYAFASVCLFGEDNNSNISGIWVWRGHDLAFELSEDWQIDYASYDWKKLDAKSDETKALVDKYFKWEGQDESGKKFNQGKIFK